MKIAIIGAGLGGLSVSSILAKDGHNVTVYEKNSMPGGRAIIYKENGFTFDMGPSWYLMPDAFEYFFKIFNKKPSDYYNLIKLDPAYKVYFSDEESLIVKPDIKYMANEFEKIEKGAGNQFIKHMQQMKEKYEIGVPEFLLKEYNSIFEFINKKILINPLKLELHKTYHQSIKEKFKDTRIQKILEFMVVFLGGSPYRVPGLYNLINWADFGLNVYYPDGGFFSVSKGFEKLAKEQGVKFKYNYNVEKINIENGIAKSITVNGETEEYDIVISNADYAFTESKLIDDKYRNISKEYWEKADLSPSGICIFLGINKKINNLEHHTMVFSDGWKDHFKSIEDVKAPISPQYYVSTPSKTDSSIAPKNKENIFILIPIAPGLKDTQELREKLFNFVINDLEKKTGENITENIIHKRIIGVSDFENMYNSYKGNAFGLGHTLKHSLFFRPKNRSKKVKNLFYVGQYTNPGTGTPLVVLSGVVTSNMIKRIYG